ncbi:MAG TPA: hypothetical protein VFT59_05885 [Candidatus Saccharimonadales bacterium]|nr:hypothetical protein [Candidatus Saccharimonadales bacterium]
MRHLLVASMFVGVSLAVMACSTPEPKDVKQWATERGFTVLEGAVREYRSYTSVGVMVGSKCTGTFYSFSSDSYPKLDVYNKETGITIAEGIRDPWRDDVLINPPTSSCV